MMLFMDNPHNYFQVNCLIDYCQIFNLSTTTTTTTTTTTITTATTSTMFFFCHCRSCGWTWRRRRTWSWRRTRTASTARTCPREETSSKLSEKLGNLIDLWQPINVINVGTGIWDHIKRMIIIISDSYLVTFNILYFWKVIIISSC